VFGHFAKVTLVLDSHALASLMTNLMMIKSKAAKDKRTFPRGLSLFFCLAVLLFILINVAVHLILMQHQSAGLSLQSKEAVVVR
jgi:hypothetical protein